MKSKISTALGLLALVSCQQGAGTTDEADNGGGGTETQGRADEGDRLSQEELQARKDGKFKIELFDDVDGDGQTDSIATDMDQCKPNCTYSIQLSSQSSSAGTMEKPARSVTVAKT